jgi:hypothetical protein
MTKNKKEKPTKDLTKGLEKFFKEKGVEPNNETAFNKAVKASIKKPDSK